MVYSRHTNLQEKLLGDLRRKLLWGIVDPDLGQRPCNYPCRFKVNGACAYGGDDTCRTSGTVYKVTCKANENCKCFYIGKSQRYIKTQVQEHIGEVSKLYAKYILWANQLQKTTHSSLTQQSTSTTQSGFFSLAMQEENLTIYKPPSSFPPHCVLINNTHQPQPTGLRMQVCNCTQSNVSSISNRLANLPPFHKLLSNETTSCTSRSTTSATPTEAPPPPKPPPNHVPKQKHCSALAWHLFSYAKHLKFNTKAKVADWCRSNFKVEIIWQQNPISLLKTASTKSCHLCAAEHMIISHNFNNKQCSSKIINLKNKMSGVCSCKTRLLRFARQSD